MNILPHTSLPTCENDFYVFWKVELFVKSKAKNILIWIDTANLLFKKVSNNNITKNMLGFLLPNILTNIEYYQSFQLCWSIKKKTQILLF